MLFSVCSFFMILLQYSYQYRDCSSPDYFWRPYRGHIPPDAYVAGKDYKGDQLYIGMRNSVTDLVVELLTRSIHEKDGFSYIEKDVPDDPDTFQYKHILCVDPKSSIDWVNADPDLDKITKRCCLVEGGVKAYRNQMYTSVIGRSEVCNEVVVGYRYKEKSWKGLHATNGTKLIVIPDYYQLLTYNCDDICKPPKAKTEL